MKPRPRERAHKLLTKMAEIVAPVEDEVLTPTEPDEILRDPLTGLPNRSFFTNAVERCATRAERSPEFRYAVLFLDLDKFKRINDTLGHAVGDELLRSVANRLEMCVRKGDIVARMGGDEFTVLLDDVQNIRNATRVAEEILTMMSLPFRLTGLEVSTSASVGLSLNTPDQNNPSKLLRDADMAMYRAKDAGRGRYEVFDAVMHAQSVARMKLEAELRVAVERREFSLFYQPIIALGAKQIVGFEALVRWHHPERGTLSADQFITVADETGLILPLGRWILRQACRQMGFWHAHFDREVPLTVSVNICARELNTPGLVERLHNLLKESALPPGSLRLEINEGFIVQQPDFASTILKQISDADVQIQMDNFGTGMSSLNSLHNYPISAIKIDGEFVDRAGARAGHDELVKAMVSLASAMNIEVVAEGIETVEQLRNMESLGCCQFGQGYLYSHPVDAETATAMLAAGGTVDALDPKVYMAAAKYGIRMSA